VPAGALSGLLKKNVRLEGLQTVYDAAITQAVTKLPVAQRRLLVAGGNAGQVDAGMLASFTHDGHNTVTFHAPDSPTSGTPINVLPYLQGAVTYSNTNEHETISGPFTGCRFGSYVDPQSGQGRIAHVDTQTNSERMCPSLELWDSMSQAGKQQVNTSGMTPGHVPGASIVGIASADGKKLETHPVVREGKDYVVIDPTETPVAAEHQASAADEHGSHCCVIA
jgi:hypothetical protein